MGHQFAQHNAAEVPVSPDEVWAAIATGPGIDSWFMGRNEVTPGTGGTVCTVFGEYAPELEITGWNPGHRLAYRSHQAPDGQNHMVKAQAIAPVLTEFFDDNR